jgi:hypothetical protein
MLGIRFHCMYINELGRNKAKSLLSRNVNIIPLPPYVNAICVQRLASMLILMFIFHHYYQHNYHRNHSLCSQV